MARRGLSPLVLLTITAALVAFPLVGCGDGDDAVDADQPVSSPATTSPSEPPPDASGNELTVAVEPSPAAPGSTVQAKVLNGTGKQFTYGAGYEIDQDVDGAWEAVELPLRPVLEIAYVAPPGKGGAALEVELPDDLEPGTYRVVVMRDAPGFGLVAGEFEVASD